MEVHFSLAKLFSIEATWYFEEFKWLLTNEHITALEGLCFPLADENWILGENFLVFKILYIERNTFLIFIQSKNFTKWHKIFIVFPNLILRKIPFYHYVVEMHHSSLSSCMQLVFSTFFSLRNLRHQAISLFDIFILY